MKHAILIMAHKNYSFLHHLIEYFERDCYVFVHIDKKSKITKDEIACLREMPQVFGVYQKYSVHWGGFSILKCERFLLDKALRGCDADYFHLISGQDYPIKPLDYFLKFFLENKGKEFFQFVHLPHYKWEKNTYDRFCYYYINDYVERNKKSIDNVNKFVKWQKQHGIKRSIPNYFPHLYGGSQWFSITRLAVKTLLNYTHRHPAFFRRLRFTFAPEETYISTVLKNLLTTETIVPRNLRFIRWQKENGSYPANLSLSHFCQISIADWLFARKIEQSVSDSLVNMIDTYLLKDEKITFLKNGGWNYKGFLKYDYNEQLMFYIHRFCLNYNMDSVLDLGCGAGYYVAALRRMRIAITGVDANPHSPFLSSLLLPENDEPCYVSDITKDMETDSLFDLCLCINVLPCINKEKWEKVINNITNLTNRIAIVSIMSNQSNEILYLQNIFLQYGMKLNAYLTKDIRITASMHGINQFFFIFEKIHTQSENILDLFKNRE